MKNIIFISVLLHLLSLSFVVNSQEITMPEHNEWNTYDRVIDNKVTTYYYNFDPRPGHESSYLSISCLRTTEFSSPLIEVGTNKPFLDDIKSTRKIHFNFDGNKVISIDAYPVSTNIVLSDLVPELRKNLSNSSWVYIVITDAEPSNPVHGFLLSTKYMDKNHKVFNLCE